MSILHEGWLTKDGHGFMGSAKKRYCVLKIAEHGKTFIFDYFVDETKADQKGTFLVSRNSKFTKSGATSFTVEITSAESRKSGSAVEFEAVNVDSFKLWEKAFLLAENPLKPSMVKTNDLMVIGASNSLGVSTIQALTKYTKDFVVFAGVSDLNAPENDALNLKGINLVHADMEEPSTMEAAFAGIDCLFIVVPVAENRGLLSIDTIKAAVAAKVAHVVVISSPTPAGTIFGDQFLPVEEYVKNAGIKFTIVRLPVFMENINGQLESIGGIGEFYSPVASTVKVAAASLRDLGECIGKIMANYTQYAGMTLNLNGPAYSEQSYAEAFSKVVGKPVKHVKVTDVDFKAKNVTFPQWVVDGTLQWYKLSEKQDSCVSADISDLAMILGRELTSPDVIALSSAPKLKIIHESWLAAEKEKEEKRLAALAARKAEIEAFLKSTPAPITKGSWQQKKLSSESLFGFRARYIWIDFEKKVFAWSKTESKTDAFKTCDLTSDKTSYEVVNDVIVIKVTGEPNNIELKVDDTAAWTTAFAKALKFQG